MNYDSKRRLSAFRVRFKISPLLRAYAGARRKRLWRVRFDIPYPYAETARPARMRSRHDNPIRPPHLVKDVQPADPNFVMMLELALKTRSPRRRRLFQQLVADFLAPEQVR